MLAQRERDRSRPYLPLPAVADQPHPRLTEQGRCLPMSALHGKVILMDSNQDSAVLAMSIDECWNLLARCELGRLATSVNDIPDIFPVNYVVDGPSVLFRTAPGSKLAEISANRQVAFEVDEYDDAQAASVVIKGPAKRLELQSEIDAADALGLASWAPTLKYRWVRIAAHSVTGRRFERAPEPARYRVSDVDDRS